MKHLAKLIISLLMLTVTIRISAQDSKVLKIINDFKDAEGALHKRVDTENIMISTDSLSISNADMKITVNDGGKFPEGARSVDILMFMGEDNQVKKLDKRMKTEDIAEKLMGDGKIKLN